MCLKKSGRKYDRNTFEHIRSMADDYFPDNYRVSITKKKIWKTQYYTNLMMDSLYYEIIRI